MFLFDIFMLIWLSSFFIQKKYRVYEFKFIEKFCYLHQHAKNGFINRNTHLIWHPHPPSYTDWYCLITIHNSIISLIIYFVTRKRCIFLKARHIFELSFHILKFLFLFFTKLIVISKDIQILVISKKISIVKLF